jgi:hypothetical protein
MSSWKAPDQNARPDLYCTRFNWATTISSRKAQSVRETLDVIFLLQWGHDDGREFVEQLRKARALCS